jgi:mannosyltransferase OCH1-like enzyme
MQSTTAIFGGRLPKQLRRALPVYIACVLVVLFFSKANPVRLSLPATDVLKRVLSYQTPLQATETIFPRKIWQTWKVNPLEFEERDSVRARSWTSMNPGYRYEVLTDGNDLHYVETNFGPGGLNRPDIVDVYRSLTAMIIKADLLRYLVMYIEGGVYADIDVEALKPVDSFIPSHIDESNVDLVVSVEIDEPTYANHTILGPKSQSFCQWTFVAKPRLALFLRLVDHILMWLEETAKQQNVPLGEIVLNFDDVITGTGPSAFTGLVLAEMSRQTGKPVTWDYFHSLGEPRQVGSILVLTVEAFAAGQGHSNSGNHNSEKALVKHHYHASLWPSRHPRYSHPAYGKQS